MKNLLLVIALVATGISLSACSSTQAKKSPAGACSACYAK